MLSPSSMNRSPSAFPCPSRTTSRPKGFFLLKQSLRIEHRSQPLPGIFGVVRVVLRRKDRSPSEQDRNGFQWGREIGEAFTVEISNTGVEVEPMGGRNVDLNVFGTFIGHRCDHQAAPDEKLKVEIERRSIGRIFVEQRTNDR